MKDRGIEEKGRGGAGNKRGRHFGQDLSSLGLPAAPLTSHLALQGVEPLEAVILATDETILLLMGGPPSSPGPVDEDARTVGSASSSSGITTCLYPDFARPPRCLLPP